MAVSSYVCYEHAVIWCRVNRLDIICLNTCWIFYEK